MAHGGEHHTVKIRGQPILLQPVGHLVLANQVGHNAQLVSPLVQGSDHFCPAVHHHTPAFGLAVLKGQLMADLGNALLVIVRQQPPAPELPVASLLVLSQGPAAIGLVAVFYQLIEVLHLQRCPRQLRHLPAGMAHIGLILQRNPKGAAQVEQDGPVPFFVHPSSLSADRQMLSGSAAHSSYAPNANVFDFLSLFYGRLLFSVKGRNRQRHSPVFAILTKSPEIAVLY